MAISFADQILSGLHGHAWELASADVLLGFLGTDHPLYLPIDDQGELMHNFAALDFYLDGLARADRAPDLPVNIEPLIGLCRRHRKRIVEAELWSYKLYYLELLSQEGKLRPLFWGNVDILKPAFFPSAVLEHFASGATTPPEDRRPLMQEIWDLQARGWVRDKTIVRPNADPWLTRLRYFPQRDRHWDDPEFGFSDCLGFVMQPFYCLRDALHVVRRCMREELWTTSVFSPLPTTPDHRTQWRQHAARFMLKHFLRTEQRRRKLEFKDFVRQQSSRGGSIRGIASEALTRRLWPYGTPRRSRTEEYDAQASCERAVARVLRELRREVAHDNAAAYRSQRPQR